MTFHISPFHILSAGIVAPDHGRWASSSTEVPDIPDVISAEYKAQGS